MRPNAAIPIGALCAFTGCLSGGGEDPKPILPLAVGNSWAYADTAFYADDSIGVLATYVDIAGTRTITLDGEACTVFLSNTHREPNVPDPASLHVRNEGATNFTYGAEKEGLSVTHRVLHVKWPAKAGEEYETRFVSVGVDSAGGAFPVLDTVNIQVLNVDTTCVVPAGTFPCVHYRGVRKSGAIHADAFYAPGVGYLGSEIRRTLIIRGAARNVLFTKRLVSYTLH